MNDLDEARDRFWKVSGWKSSGLNSDFDRLIAAERADAERAQRERADVLHESTIRLAETSREWAMKEAAQRERAEAWKVNSNKAIAEANAQRERADGLERTLAREAAIYKKAIAQSVSNEQATRPYRMAIAKLAHVMDLAGVVASGTPEFVDLRSLISGADIARAREEGK